MNIPTHLFNIESSNQLFYLLNLVAKRFTTGPTKRPEDLLLLIFGLTHLREWIAPGYLPKRTATTPSEQFYQSIFELEEFKVLQALCNRSKHMRSTESVMGTLYEGKIDDWPDIDSVLDFDRGPPRAYFVDEKDLDDIIRTVITFYDEHWFKIANEKAKIP